MGMLELFKRMWLGWQGVAAGILFLQNGLLMSVAYFLGVGPVAIVFRLMGRTMIDRAPAQPGAATYWQPRSGKPQTMEEASRQF